MAVRKQAWKDGKTTYYATYTGPDGRLVKERVRVVKSGASKRDHDRAEARAKTRAEDQRLAVLNETWEDPRRAAREALGLTVGKAATGYRASRPTKSTSSLTDIWSVTNYFGEDTRLRQINVAWAEKWKIDRLSGRASSKAAKTRKGKPVGPSTVRKEILFARAVWRWAAKRGAVPSDPEKNPFTQISLPKEPPGKDHYLTFTQEQALLNYLNGDSRSKGRGWRRPKAWHARVFVWMILTGMDVGEVRDLDWSDVDLEAGVVKARRQKSGVARVVHLDDDTRALLDECASRLQKKEGPVFRNEKSKRWTANAFRCAMCRAFVAAGVPHPKGGPTKILRHTALTRDLMAHGNLRVTQEKAGHTNPAQTARYAKIADGQLREAARKAADLRRRGLEEVKRRAHGGGS